MNLNVDMTFYTNRKKCYLMTWFSGVRVCQFQVQLNRSLYKWHFTHRSRTGQRSPRWDLDLNSGYKLKTGSN